MIIVAAFNFPIKLFTCQFEILTSLSKYFIFTFPRLIFTLLIPERVMGLPVDSMWWIIMVPSELFPSMFNLSKSFMIQRPASMLCEFRTHCMIIIKKMHILLAYRLSCGAGQYYLAQFFNCSLVKLSPLRRRWFTALLNTSMWRTDWPVTWIFYDGSIMNLSH